MTTFFSVGGDLTYAVAAVRGFVFHILQAVLAHVESLHFPVLVWIGREVPCVDLELADAQRVYVFNFGDGFVLLFQRGGRGVHFRVRLLDVIYFVVAPLLVAGDLPLRALADEGRVQRCVVRHRLMSRRVSLAVLRRRCLFILDRVLRQNLVRRHPLVQAPVQAGVMDVVLRHIALCSPRLNDCCLVQRSVLPANRVRLADLDVRHGVSCFCVRRIRVVACRHFHFSQNHSFFLVCKQSKLYPRLHSLFTSKRRTEFDVCGRL